jgi:hypothetical protein
MQWHRDTSVVCVLRSVIGLLHQCVQCIADFDVYSAVCSIQHVTVLQCAHAHNMDASCTCL